MCTSDHVFSEIRNLKIHLSEHLVDFKAAVNLEDVFMCMMFVNWLFLFLCL